MRLLSHSLLWLSASAVLVVSSCGVFPVYETHWFAIPGEVPRDKTIAFAICRPIAAGAKAKAELQTDWPKDIDGNFSSTYDPDVFSYRSDTIKEATMTSCMAEQGWYPERVCIDNCSNE